MYKIRLLLLLLALGGVGFVWGQPTGSSSDHGATFSPRRPQPRAARPARIQTVKHGALPEPALPDSSTNPVPAPVAARPEDTLLRRRKLRVRFRG